MHSLLKLANYVMFTSASTTRTRVRTLLCHVRPWANFITLHSSTSLALVNEYLATNSGGCQCTNSVCALIKAWLDASREAGIVRD